MRSRKLKKRVRQAAPHVWLFVLGSLVFAAALGVTYYVFVRTTTGQFADESAWREAKVADNLRGPVLQFLDNLPLFSVIIAAVVVLFVTLVRRRWMAAAIALGTVAAANLSTQLLKNLLLDRPERGVPTLDFNSLPSGHTTLAASAAAAVFLVVSPRWRPFAAAAGGTYSVAAGMATFVNLWHRPSDIVAAYLVVATWTLLGGVLIMRTGNSWNVWSGHREHWAASRFWSGLCWLAGLGALAGCAALYLYAEAVGPAPIPGTGRTPLFFWSGLLLVVGIGFSLNALLVSLFSCEARRRR